LITDFICLLTINVPVH